MCSSDLDTACTLYPALQMDQPAHGLWSYYISLLDETDELSNYVRNPRYYWGELVLRMNLTSPDRCGAWFDRRASSPSTKWQTELHARGHAGQYQQRLLRTLPPEVLQKYGPATR